MVEVDLSMYFKYTEPMEKAMDFEEWLAYGVANGFCSEQFCETHAGLPLSPTELELWDEGQDPCCHVVRLGTETDWESDAQALKGVTND